MLIGVYGKSIVSFTIIFSTLSFPVHVVCVWWAYGWAVQQRLNRSRCPTGWNVYIKREFICPLEGCTLFSRTFAGPLSCLQCFYLQFWRCWLGGRKGIRPVKNWVVGCWRGYLLICLELGADGPADATATHCLLPQQNPDWLYLKWMGTDLLIWYRLTRIVLDKGPLNGCVCVCCWPL